jgi:hypothetical protein
MFQNTLYLEASPSSKITKFFDVLREIHRLESADPLIIESLLSEIAQWLPDSKKSQAFAIDFLSRQPVVEEYLRQRILTLDNFCVMRHDNLRDIPVGNNFKDYALIVVDLNRELNLLQKDINSDLESRFRKIVLVQSEKLLLLLRLFQKYCSRGPALFETRDDYEGFYKPTNEFFKRLPPKVTFITSVFCSNEYLISYMKNIEEAANIPNVEILILSVTADDEEFKFLRDYLERYPNISYLIMSDDPGLYDLWNLGIHLARSPYCGNWNLDDRRHPLQLTKCINHLESTGCDVVSTQIQPISSYNSYHQMFFKSSSEPYFNWLRGFYDIHDMYIKKNGTLADQCVPHCMPVWRKEIHKTVGFFDEYEYRSAADYALWLRAMRSGFKFFIVDQALSYYYVNPTSYMRNDDGQSGAVQKAINDYVESNELKKPPYFPDFKHLESLIRFSIRGF